MLLGFLDRFIAVLGPTWENNKKMLNIHIYMCVCVRVCVCVYTYEPMCIILTESNVLSSFCVSHHYYFSRYRSVCRVQASAT